MNQLYCQAILPHAGLGNRLFPWARCRVFAHMHNVPMLATNWAQIKLGPLIRGERDLRIYYDLFQPRGDEVAGLVALWLQWRAHKLVEPVDLAQVPQDTRHAPSLVSFVGESDHFHRLNGWEQFIAIELRAITRPRWLASVAQFPPMPIAIHVRRGDFIPLKSPEDIQFKKGSFQTPLEWFIESLQIIRAVAGWVVPTYVISDGDDEQIEKLLALEGVKRVTTGSAISDMLLLSKARVLIASGGSSFSAWASFLGQMPTIVSPGHSLSWFKIADTTTFFRGAFDPRCPVESFLLQARTLLSNIKD